MIRSWRAHDGATNEPPHAKHRLDRRRRDTSALDQGLDLLNERLGNTSEKLSDLPVAHIEVIPTATMSRNIFYAPDMDGQAESGEVVWFSPPTDPPQERSMLVVGRDRHEVLGLLISANENHTDDEDWLPIGSGEWQASGTPCWVRLDKVLSIPEDNVRRRGTLFPPRRFERIADSLRKRFDWS
ncbi:type II toxin-antitoxin system PemK/MazF family toxin [Corynebacterium aquatimens]|uniref:PemK-like protein n=1 Tax=Corynebacterium aquatimens TaxID=1190508 RepID=A0A931GXP6_9CORY|nr:type II toxin-antitoxin system PemK/MazF family toxin [Corynebacterium aquatimens]MBG6122114.1 hypothetical protein [Corynebacterium aquatimens]